MAKKAAKPTTKKAVSKTTKASAKKVSPTPATKAPATPKAAKKASKKAAKKSPKKPSSELLLTTEDIQQLVTDLRKKYPKPEKDLLVEIAIDDQHVADATPGPKKGDWLIMTPGSDKK